MLKSAFLGCGPRARGQARAYQHVNRGAIAAACDRHPEKLNAFCDDLGIDGRYDDIHAMLDDVSPDLLHIVTNPQHRVSLMTVASEHRVPVALVEKPIALQGEDWRALSTLSKKTDTRFLVNTQLHFHRKNIELRTLVANGGIGDVRSIDISARSTILNQGVHILELAHSYNGYAKPTTVFASASGVETFATNEPSPDTAIAAVEFANGVRCHVTTGFYAPIACDSESKYHHKQIAVFGSRGFIHWTMAGWERYTETGGFDCGDHDYGTEDDLAQGALTDAAFELRGDRDANGETSLDRSLEQFNIILGAYMSVIERRPIDLPCDPPDNLLESLESVLTTPS